MLIFIWQLLCVCMGGRGCSRCEFLWNFLQILFLLIFHDYQSTMCMHLLNMHTSTLFIYFNFRWKIKLNSVYTVAWFYNHCSTNFPLIPRFYKDKYGIVCMFCLYAECCNCLSGNVECFKQCQHTISTYQLTRIRYEIFFLSSSSILCPTQMYIYCKKKY